MDWEDPDLWRWLWLLAAVVFALGELAIPTSFFLASFALGALAACLVAFLGGALALQWLAFVGISLALVLVLRPYSRRLDRQTASVATAGADRWVGKTATVLREIPGGVGDTGMVRLEREEWRAESRGGADIAAGALVRIVAVDGTRMIVEALGAGAPDASGPPPSPPTE